MKAGKLSITLEDHKTLGKVFIIKADNHSSNVFQVVEDEFNGPGFGKLTLRVTPETMLLISQYVDEMFSDDVNGLSNATH